MKKTASCSTDRMLSLPFLIESENNSYRLKWFGEETLRNLVSFIGKQRMKLYR
jgi:hypothetical protein